MYFNNMKLWLSVNSKISWSPQDYLGIFPVHLIIVTKGFIFKLRTEIKKKVATVLPLIFKIHNKMNTTNVCECSLIVSRKTEEFLFLKRFLFCW